MKTNRRGELLLNLCFYGEARSIHLVRWATFFAQKGHSVHVICEDAASITGVTTHFLQVPRGAHAARFVHRIPKLRKLLKEIKPEILHAHTITTYGYWAALTGFHPFVLTAWGSDVYIAPKRSFSDGFFTRNALRAADLVTVDSQDLAREVIKLGAAPSKVRLIQFGVDLKRFNNTSPSSLRLSLEIPEDAAVVLSMRNLRPLYNHTVVMEAAVEVLRALPNTYFLFAGRGEQKRELETLASRLGITDKVKVLGEQPWEKIPEFLAISDVFISIPDSDATSVTLLEAMATCRPVIVSDLPSNREWVEEEKSGFIVPPRSPAKVAAAISALLSNPELRRVMGKRGREIAEERASQEKNMAGMEELYSSLLEKRQYEANLFSC